MPGFCGVGALWLARHFCRLVTYFDKVYAVVVKRHSVAQRAAGCVVEAFAVNAVDCHRSGLCKADFDAVGCSRNLCVTCCDVVNAAFAYGYDV